MEREGFGSEASAAKGGGTGAGEVEAAEALAGLSWCSASCDGAVSSGELKCRRETDSQDKLMATGQFNCHASSMAASSKRIEKIAKNIPRCRQSNPMRRPKLTEAERQAKQVRRILANREAARQTIKRRQANLLELTKKVAEVSEESENLKKEKEHAVKKYNSLKLRNEFLKAQVSNTKKAKPRDSQDPKISWSNQPSIAPCFWPSIFRPPDVFKQRCDVGLPQFPLFFYPNPWLFPFFSQGTPPHSYPTKVTENGKICRKCSCLVSSPQEKSNSHLSTNWDSRKMAVSNSKKHPSRTGPTFSLTISGGKESASGWGPTFPPEISSDKKSASGPAPTFLSEISCHKKSTSGPGPTFPPEVSGDKKSTCGPTFPPEVSGDKKSTCGPTFLPEISGDDANTVCNPDGTIFVPGLFSRVRPQEKLGPTGDDASRESTVGIEMHKESNPDGTIFVPGLFSRMRPQEKLGPTGDDASRESTVGIEMHKEMESVCSATAKARRKRKMLMRTKHTASRHQANAR